MPRLVRLKVDREDEGGIGTLAFPIDQLACVWEDQDGVYLVLKDDQEECAWTCVDTFDEVLRAIETGWVQ